MCLISNALKMQTYILNLKNSCSTIFFSFNTSSQLCSLESVKNQANLDNEEAHKQLAALSANLEES